MYEFSSLASIFQQGNQPLAKELRGDMGTHEFSALIATYLPLLPQLEKVQDDWDQEVCIKELNAQSSLTERLLHIHFSKMYSILASQITGNAAFRCRRVQ